MKGSIPTLVLYTHILFFLSFCTITGYSHGGPRASRHFHIRTLPSHLTRSISLPASTKEHMDMGNNAQSEIRNRRISSIIGQLKQEKKDIPAWLSTLGPDGKWPDSEVDYTRGCEARRANWPAQHHWRRIVIMTAAWHGGLEGADNYTKDETLRSAVSRAVDYWLGRDFNNLACLDSGGTDACPCDEQDNTFWNTNWYSNVILIPGLVGQTCLILNDTLSSSQLESCIRMTKRSYEYNVDGLTGANTLDVCRIGMDQALLTSNADLLADAYRRSHTELKIMNGVKADGIRADGAFGQHDGMLYNGNYGKDYVNAILGIEHEAAGTEFSANDESKAAFGTLFDGDRWMIFRNTLTGVLHWDFSALGRFISFPVADLQATGSIKINLTAVGELGREWQSQSLIEFDSSLSKPTMHANAGNLQGNRMFYTNDYMVHRGQNYVSTLKMWSSRTRHTECTNSQNPLGFHLADGVLYNYLQGNEYEDIAAAWDWNLIPGTTTDYGATPLQCSNTKLLGIEAFVGGVSDGKVGIAAMRYTNPSTRALHWQKAWFFLDNDVQHVMISGLSSTSDAPVYSVLDQRRQTGPIFVDGKEQQTSDHPSAQSLWHGGVGYKFPGNGIALSVEAKQKTGDWSKIGISTQPPTTVDLFSAWIPHQSLDTPVSYTAFLGTTLESFTTKSLQLKLRSIQNDVHVSAVFDEAHDTLMVVFWDAAGGSVTFQSSSASSPITLSVDNNAAVIYKVQTGDITVSDPSQSISSIRLVLSEQGGSKTFDFALPSGGLAGSSVTKKCLLNPNM